MSLPTPIRKELAAFNKAVRAAYPGKIVMTRPDVHSLSLVAFTKNDGGKSWDRCPLTHRIPNNILDSNFATTTDFGFDIFSDPMTEEETNLKK